jgi:hypothetical protein
VGKDRKINDQNQRSQIVQSNVHVDFARWHHSTAISASDYGFAGRKHQLTIAH